TQLASEYSARAFTVGTDIAFGRGEYRPGSLSGDLMIAHELAHVIQQKGGTPTPASAPLQRDDSPSLEADANSSAVRAIVPPPLLASRRFKEYASTHASLQQAADASAAVVPSRPAGLSLQRCGSDVDTQPGGELLAAAPTTTEETFEGENVPGVSPRTTLHSGVHEFTFDGDGDQMRELGAKIHTLSSWPSGAARRIRVDITMLNTSEVQSATYELADTPGGAGPLHTLFMNPTDGRRPSEISLIAPIGTQQLLFYPPVRTAQTITYRAEL